MSNKRNTIIISVISVLLAINLLATGFLLVDRFKKEEEVYSEFEFEESVGYTLYIGVNGKNALPFVTIDEAQEILNDICLKHVEGYTVFRANGAWTSPFGFQVVEDTLVCVILNATDTQIFKIVYEAKSALDQQSILVEKNYNEIVFY